jgi:hypothetical protein
MSLACGSTTPGGRREGCDDSNFYRRSIVAGKFATIRFAPKGKYRRKGARRYVSPIGAQSAQQARNRRTTVKGKEGIASARQGGFRGKKSVLLGIYPWLSVRVFREPIKDGFAPVFVVRPRIGVCGSFRIGN